MGNLAIWNEVRSVPKEAKKPIVGGRMKGKTDINPMWRIKVLTEMFGICGIGWTYTIESQRLEECANGEVAAFVDIFLFVKHNGEWSQAIPGIGGNMFIAKESGGLRTSDECFKMALTDAISVACKALGIGADVYWDKDNTKYTKQPEIPQKTTTPTPPPKVSDKDKIADIGKKVMEMVHNDKTNAKKMLKVLCNVDDLKKLTTDKMIEDALKKTNEAYKEFKAVK